MKPPLAISFDFGQTLADLDVDLLSQRLAERAAHVPPSALETSMPLAWRIYNESIKGGLGGHPWKFFMRRLLTEAAAPEAEIEALVDWLWTEQPHKNLWRKPVPGMIELVQDLGRAGVKVAIISNSEGRLSELVSELGWLGHFAALADSGKLGVEKPGPAIFEWTAERLGVPVERMVHVGDSYAADVEGALGAGLRAIWFRAESGAPYATSDKVTPCQDAAELRAIFASWGIPLAT